MLDTEQVICRLLDEAVAAFDFESGVVYLGPESRQRLLHTCGEWKGQAEIGLPLEQGRRYLGWIALGRRCNGLEYTPRDREGLQEVVALIMEAISRQSAMGEAQ